MAVVTRTIKLRRKLVKIARTRRIKKSIDYLREDVARHSRSKVENIKISGELNHYMLDKVARRMKAVKITVDKVGDEVKVDLAPELKQVIKTVVPEKKTDKKSATAPAAAPVAPAKKEQKPAAPKAPKEAPKPAAPQKTG